MNTDHHVWPSTFPGKFIYGFAIGWLGCLAGQSVAYLVTGEFDLVFFLFGAWIFSTMFGIGMGILIRDAAPFWHPGRPR